MEQWDRGEWVTHDVHMVAAELGWAVYSHCVNSHCVNVDELRIDTVGIVTVGIYTVGIVKDTGM